MAEVARDIWVQRYAVHARSLGAVLPAERMWSGTKGLADVAQRASLGEGSEFKRAWAMVATKLAGACHTFDLAAACLAWLDLLDIGGLKREQLLTLALGLHAQAGRDASEERWQQLLADATPVFFIDERLPAALLIGDPSDAVLAHVMTKLVDGANSVNAFAVLVDVTGAPGVLDRVELTTWPSRLMICTTGASTKDVAELAARFPNLNIQSAVDLSEGRRVVAGLG